MSKTKSTSTRNDEDTRRHAVIFVAAPGANRRAARGLIHRVIQDTLGTTNSYESAALHDGAEGRFVLDVTDSEWNALTTAIHHRAEQEGWSGAPMDGYHD